MAAKGGGMEYLFVAAAIVAAAGGAVIRFNANWRGRWITWVVLALSWVAGVFLGWLGLGWDPAAALVAVAGSSILGAVSREIVLGIGEALRHILNGIGQGLAHLLRRILPFVAGGAALVGLYLYQPKLLNQILVLCVICVGIWVMLRPLFTRGRRNR